MDGALPSLDQVLSSWAGADGSWALTPEEEADESVTAALGIRRLALRGPVTEAWLRGVLRRRMGRDGWTCLDEVADHSADAGRSRRIDVLALRVPHDPSWGLLQRLALEVKTSRADFLSDIRDSSKQDPWRALSHAHAYLAPAGLIRPSEVPAGSGLLEVCREQILSRGVEYPRMWWSVPPLPRRPGPVPDWLIHQLLYRCAERGSSRFPLDYQVRVPAAELVDAGFPAAVADVHWPSLFDDLDSVDEAAAQAGTESQPASRAGDQDDLFRELEPDESAGAGLADGPAERRLQVALEWLSQQPAGPPAADEYMECWRLSGEDHWEHFDPKEDLAIEPTIIWPAEIQALALAAYNERYGEYLDHDEFYVFVWPPDGRLWTGGGWHYPDRQACREHADDGPDQDCDTCLRTVDEPIVQPAQWEWTIEVQTWTLHLRADGMKVPVHVIHDEPVTDRWTLGYTTMDPRQVWFGRRP